MPLPLPILGERSQFECLRHFLDKVGYRDGELCRRLGLDSLDYLELATLPEARVAGVRDSGPFNAITRLFLLGRFVDEGEMDAVVPSDVRAASEALGLVARTARDPARYASTVALYPVEDLYFVSDRWINPDLSPIESFPDVVYPALTKSTKEFLRFLPRDHCQDFLEVCAGSGIAAIVASQSSGQSWSADITARSTQFAKFNVALNGLSNVTVVEGDLYEPLGAKAFDRIAAHPPYMPVLQPAEIYYDGGEDGERLTRRIVEGLLLNLRPGGRLYCRTLGTDRAEHSFERRVREWLGPAEAEFDVAFFVSKNIEASRFATDSALRKCTGPNEVSRWLTHLARLGIKEMLTGMLVVQRIESSRPVFTIRRSLAPTTSLEETEWLLRWQTEMMNPGALRGFEEFSPVAAPTLQITARHRLESGQVTASDFTLTSSFPFLMDCRIEPWMGSLLALCDGTRTIRRIHEESIASQWIRPDTPIDEFVEWMQTMISGGFLTLTETPKPRAAQ